ncbi:MAG TPA: tetratricopeptide repeat protein [Steroidobacteraceae bacterium]|nr:tetratricopeptide repeat protein [Steroidobacteraceae bacterium]
MVRDSRKIAAILAADVVDYSRLMGADEAGTLAALAIRRALFDNLVREFDGRVFGSVGDSLMAEFTSAVHAVECARAVQDAVTSENTGIAPGKQMRLRIGVNLGDVIEGKDGVAGDAVNVAARLQALAKPGGVLISGTVYDHVHLKIPARYVDAGTRRVKNVAEPVRVFEVLRLPESIGGRLGATFSRYATRHAVRVAAVVTAFALVAAIGLFWRDIPVPTTGRTLGEVVQPESSAPPGSIAVLPFINMTGDPASDYLGDGLAEELIHRLSRIPGLRVAPRRSAFAYKGKDVDVRGIADALGVNYVVEGSVRRQGDLVRVNASLVDRTTGANEWSHSYESTGDFLAIEDKIGTQVLAALERILSIDAEAAPAPQTIDDIAAYDLYLQGLSYLRKPKTARTLDAAEQLFQRSLAEEADFARAQAGLCQTRVERFLLERVPAHVAAAEKACARARALDDSAFEVHEAVGSLQLVTGNAAESEAAYRRALAVVPESPDALIGLAAALADGGKPVEAERTFERAIAMQPRYAASHVEYGSFLFRQGRALDAIAPWQRATVLEPDNPSAFNNLGVAYLYAGSFEQAAEAFSRSLAIEPTRSGYSNTGMGFYYHGQFGQAAEMFRKATELTPSDHRPWGNLADALLFGGQPAKAERAYARALELAEAELAVNPKLAINQAQTAYYSSRLRHGDRARQCIENALADGDNDGDVHYYVGLAELGLGDEERAAFHVRRARELGYPEVFLKSAPELNDIRTII